MERQDADSPTIRRITPDVQKGVQLAMVIASTTSAAISAEIANRVNAAMRTANKLATHNDVTTG